MSAEHAESVRAFIASFNDGGESELIDFFSEDIEIDWSRSPAPYRGVYRVARPRSGGSTTWVRCSSQDESSRTS